MNYLQNLEKNTSINEKMEVELGMKQKIAKKGYKKENRGITLVALVVTIIVLLILAGVTIMTVFGDNGLITMAQKAKTETENSQANATEGMGNLANAMNGVLNGSGTTDGGGTGGNTGEVNANYITNKLNGTKLEKTDSTTTDKLPYQSTLYTYNIENGKSIQKIQLTGPDNTSSSEESDKTSLPLAQGMTLELKHNGEVVLGLPSGASAGTYTKNGSVDVTFTFTDGTTNTDSFLYDFNITLEQPCLVSGTYILIEEEDEDEEGKKTKKRKKKKIEDITYDDNLVVWNFDKGCFETAKPLWIMKKHETQRYNLLKFSDGSELKTVNQHRIFNKEAGKFTYPMTDETPIGTTTFASNGKEVQLISKEVIEENVDYYNIISYYHMNVFANGILTSCRFSNLYSIEDMKYVKDNRELVDKEEYKNIPEEYFYGLRLAEQPKELNRGNDVKFANSIEEYVQNNLIAKAKERE